MTALLRDPGDFPIFGGSTQSVAQTVAGYDRVVAGLFGLPASIWDTRTAKRLVPTTFLAWFDGAAPGENQCVY